MTKKLEVGKTYTSENVGEWFCIAVDGDIAHMRHMTDRTTPSTWLKRASKADAAQKMAHDESLEDLFAQAERFGRVNVFARGRYEPNTYSAEFTFPTIAGTMSVRWRESWLSLLKECFTTFRKKSLHEGWGRLKTPTKARRLLRLGKLSPPTAKPQRRVTMTSEAPDQVEALATRLNELSHKATADGNHDLASELANEAENLRDRARATLEELKGDTDER